MTTPKPSWTLRDVPQDVWDALTAACEREQLPRRVIVMRALRRYLEMPIEVDQPTPERQLRGSRG